MTTRGNYVLERYSLLAELLDLPELRQGGCLQDLEVIHDFDALWKHLEVLWPVQGWLQFQSRQLAFHDGLPALESAWGMLLSAEAVLPEGESLRLGLGTAGGWSISRLTHLAEGDGLCDEVRHVAHDPNTGHLRYRRYWRIDEDQGAVQEHACFIGFE